MGDLPLGRLDLSVDSRRSQQQKGLVVPGFETVDFLQRFKIPRGVGAALIVLAFFGLLIGFGAWMAPTIREQGIELRRRYDLSAPKGVRGRNSDNTLIRRHLDWEPSTPLRVGMEQTYRWIWDQITSDRSIAVANRR